MLVSSYRLPEYVCVGPLSVFSPTLTQSDLPSFIHSPPVDIIWALVIFWRIRGKIIRTVLCCVVYYSCAQWYAYAYEQFLANLNVSSLYAVCCLSVVCNARAGSRIWAFDWYQNRWPWMTSKGIVAVILRYFSKIGSIQVHWVKVVEDIPKLSVTEM